jgi:hypothetical protein
MKTDGKAPNTTEPFGYSQLPTFFKYYSDDDKVLDGIFKDHKIRFTQPAALNDPLEFKPIIRFEHDGDNYRKFVFKGTGFPSEEERLRIGLIESQFNTFGILSLTKVLDSFDMWSRYASGHRGIALEFKPDFNKYPCMLSSKGEEYPVREVAYVEEYAINIDELLDANGLIDQDRANEKIFFTKTSRWEYEREYRLVRKLGDYRGWQPLASRLHRDQNVYLFDFSLDCIESVTFGASMEVGKKTRIMDACKGTDISFLQGVIVRDEKDSFGRPAKIQLIPVNQFPRFAEMGEFITEGNHIGDREKPLVITHLTELPYYASDPQWVHQFMKNRKARISVKHAP